MTSASDTIDDVSEKILSQILAKLHAPRLPDTLAEDVSGSDLVSLMLGIYKRRVSRVSPKAVLNQWIISRRAYPIPASRSPSIHRYGPKMTTMGISDSKYSPATYREASIT